MSNLLSHLISKPVRPGVEGFDLSSQLRAAIRTSGERPAQIAKGAGIAPSSLSRFLSGQIALSADAADRLTKYLNLRLVSLAEYAKREKVYDAWVRGELKPLISMQQNRA
jgi:transcriptional regulator with XRE-family HTH domain